MEEKVTGLVIRETDYKENDKILTVLTKELGKISVMAKGVRNSRSKNAHSVRFLCYSEFVLSGGTNNFYYMKQCSLIQSFYKISEDIVKLSLATYLSGLAGEVVPECSESGETLNLLLIAFYVLANQEKDLKIIKSAFELRLMAEQGYVPSLSGCCHCQNITDTMFFCIETGEIFCSDCGKRGMKITKNLLEALKYIVYSPINKVFSFNVSENIKNELSFCCESYALSVVGRPIKSLEYLKLFM